jgi:mono/diheme cytochrome c family protein
MMRSNVMKLLAAVICTGSLQPALAQTLGPVNGDAAAGAQLYYEHGCYGCHGFSGYGRQDLNNTGSPYLTSEEIFRAFLRARADVAPLLPSTAMPNYPANALSDIMARDIYAYVRSMPANSPEIGDIPTLRAILEAAEQRTYQP